MPDRFLYSKYSTVILVAIFLLVIIALGRETYRNYGINQEIKQLQEKIDELQKSNADFSEMQKYFQSEEFLEKEARLKLNLMKDGEKLIIVKQNESIIAGQDSGEAESGDISNIKKWWQYFFGK